MKSYFYAFFILFLCSCGSDSTIVDSTSNAKSNQFIAAFQNIESTLSLDETNIGSVTEAQIINQNLLKQFVGDSIAKNIITNSKQTKVYSFGKIVKPTESYLLVNAVTNKVHTLHTLVFNAQGVCVGHKNLTSFDEVNNSFVSNVTINREPTFFVTQTKPNANKEAKFTKLGYAFSAGNFMEVFRESNENLAEESIVNPIDAALNLNELSGDYYLNERNLFSVRDGKTKNEYQFYLHIEKNEGLCLGELKGIFTLGDSIGKAIYEAAGDPCQIDFLFVDNKVKIKERNNCGNRRGVDCIFEDDFIRKKSPQKKLPKTPMVTTNTPMPVPVPTISTAKDKKDLKKTAPEKVNKNIITVPGTIAKPKEKEKTKDKSKTVKDKKIAPVKQDLKVVKPTKPVKNLPKKATTNPKPKPAETPYE